MVKTLVLVTVFSSMCLADILPTYSARYELSPGKVFINGPLGEEEFDIGFTIQFMRALAVNQYGEFAGAIEATSDIGFFSGVYGPGGPYHLPTPSPGPISPLADSRLFFSSLSLDNAGNVAGVVSFVDIFTRQTDYQEFDWKLPDLRPVPEPRAIWLLGAIVVLIFLRLRRPFRS